MARRPPHQTQGYAIALASLELVARSPAITAIRDSFLNATAVSSAIPVSACRARELPCPIGQFPVAPFIGVVGLGWRKPLGFAAKLSPYHDR